MKSFDRFLTRAMRAIIVGSMVLMVIMVFSNVVLRYVFNSGITISEELARFCFLWLIFVGSIVVMREGGHLGVDSVVARLSRPGKIACVLVSNVLMLWVCYLFFVGSWRQTVVGWGTLMPATGIPMAFHYATGLVMSVGVGLIVLHNTWRVLSGKATDAELIQIVETEDVENEDEEKAHPDARDKTAPRDPQH
jgi:TRAP-type C4-dicarboxylate transport system permease small subunit